MHSYIFQVFESPCPQKKWASEEIFWEHPDALPVANGTSPVEDRTIESPALANGWRTIGWASCPARHLW